MIIRKTEMRDLDAAAEIYDGARAFMRDNGNRLQWANGHPNREDILSDIAMGTGYVCCEGEQVVAVFFFQQGADPTYRRIYEGKWKNDEPYAVIHRIAVKHRGRGIAEFIFSECFKMHPNIRIDTHRDNIPMQRSLEKNGFEYCGIIYLSDGSERLAYQKI